MEILNALKPKKIMSSPSDADLAQRMSYNKPPQEKVPAREVYSQMLPEQKEKLAPEVPSPVDEQIGAMSTTMPAGDPAGAMDEIMAVGASPMESAQYTPIEGPYQTPYQRAQEGIEKDLDQILDVQGEGMNMTSGGERAISDMAEFEKNLEGLSPRVQAETKRKVVGESHTVDRTNLDDILNRMKKMPQLAVTEPMMTMEDPGYDMAPETGPQEPVAPQEGGMEGPDTSAGMQEAGARLAKGDPSGIQKVQELMKNMGGGEEGGIAAHLKRAMTGTELDDNISQFLPFLLGIATGDPGTGAEVGLEAAARIRGEKAKKDAAADKTAGAKLKHEQDMEKQERKGFLERWAEIEKIYGTEAAETWGEKNRLGTFGKKEMAKAQGKISERSGKFPTFEKEEDVKSAHAIELEREKARLKKTEPGKAETRSITTGGKDYTETKDPVTGTWGDREQRFPGDASGLGDLNNKDFDRHVKPAREASSKAMEAGKKSLRNLALAKDNMNAQGEGKIFRQKIAAMSIVKQLENRMTDQDRSYYSNSLGMMKIAEEMMDEFLGDEMPTNLVEGVKDLLAQTEKIDEYVTHYATPKAAADKVFRSTKHKGGANLKAYRKELYRRFGVDEAYSKKPDVLKPNAWMKEQMEKGVAKDFGV